MAEPECLGTVKTEEEISEIVNQLKNWPVHWYIAIPFTRKRLIFDRMKYVGWYNYK